MPFISIQLNSNRPQQIGVFFDSIEATAHAPEDIEVLLHMDEGDDIMEQAMRLEQGKRRFTLRLLKTDLVKDYSTLWKPLNPLWEMTHPDAYFVINLSDEMLFETKGWDSLIRPYVGYYPDHIFRLRGSRYRFRNYTDFWECGFAPDSLAFYTRRWLELSGDWNPCLGPDSYQQCVAFHLFTSDPFSHVQHNRDIPVAELRFSGEGAGIGLQGLAHWKRVCINNRAWFILMSHRMQQEARRRAMRMKAHILAHQRAPQGGITVEEARRRRCFILRDASGNALATVPYRLPYLRTALTNLYRARWVLYYAGGGKHALKFPIFNLFVMVCTYIPYGARILDYGTRKNEQFAIWSTRRYLDYKAFKERTRHRIFHFLELSARKIRHKWIRLRTFTQKALMLKDPNGNQHSITVKVGFNALAWFAASGTYFLLLRFHHTLQPGTRHLLKLAPSRGYTRRTKDYVKAKIQAVPNLHFILSYRGFYLLIIFIRVMPRILLRLPVKAIDAVGGRLMARLIQFRNWRAERRLKGLREWQPLQFEPDFSSTTAVQPSPILFSIQLSSNRPARVVELLDNIEATAANASQVEVLIHIDTGDNAMESLLIQEKQRRKLKLVYLATDLVKGFTDLWKAYNPLFKLTDPNAYFITLFSDEMRFETQGWDTQLLAYRGYYPDHIFRIRASKYRYRNYTDFWECGFAPDSLAFYTRRWIALQGDWNPCTGPDSFQQCVSFYLFTSDPFSHIQYYRDIAAPFLRFSGEGASVGLEGETRERRIRDNNREWFKLMAPAMQENALRRAMHLKACMLRESHLALEPDKPLSVIENISFKRILLKGQDGKAVHKLDYALPALPIRLTNLLRAPLVHYYAGGGKEGLKAHPYFGMRMMINTYSPRGREWLKHMNAARGHYNYLRTGLRDRRNHILGTIRHQGLMRGRALLLRLRKQD